MAADAGDAPLLTIRNLRITVGEAQPFAKAIVDDISLTLRRGEVIGLIGESGAGKSTIGLAALGHFRGGCRLAGGSIVFDGMDLPSLPRERLARLRGVRMTYIAQSAAAAFNPAWPLLRQICEVPVLRGLLSRQEAERKAVALFRELELPDPETFGRRYPHQVSGGQLQRAMAAMAMITDPDLLVFDEPTTALDTTTQFEVLVAFRRLLRTRNAAALYITHDMGVVAQVADRILVLRHGRMVESSDTASTLERPQRSYTRALVATRARHYPPALEAASEQPALVVEGLEASYSPKVPLLRDIAFSIRPGETLALVGESGSGKSTVSRVICGLLKPRAGRILLAGEVLPPTLRRRSRDQLRRVQLIHQQPDIALNPRQSVRSIVARPVQQFFGRSRREAERRAEELLAAMGLPSGIGRLYPASLSGGQKQRVCIARALAAEPDLLICDEITSALDPLTAKEIVALLVELQRSLKTAFLFISHQLEIVSSLAHRTAVMQAGRIVELTETQRLFSPPHHPYTHKLVTSVPESRVGWLDEALAARGRAAG